MIAHDNKKARHFAGFMVFCCLVIFADSLFDILDLFVEYWPQFCIVADFFLMRFFDYVHPYVHVFLKRSAITLVDDHG